MMPTIFAAVAALELACGPKTNPGDTEAASTSGVGEMSTGTGTGTAPTTSTGPTEASGPGTGTTPDMGGSDSSSFVEPSPDMGGMGVACQLGGGDCAEGFKCNPAGLDSGSVFNGTPLCVPVVPDAKPPGEPCSVLGDPLDGTDDCQSDVVCLFPDDQGIGECHALCAVEGLNCPAELQCIGQACQTCFWGYCAAPCEPRELDACKPGEVCVDTGSAWSCVVDAGGEQGQAGDPCEFINVCDPGLACVNTELVSGCDSSGCCAPFCSTDQPNTCPMSSAKLLEGAPRRASQET